MEIVQKSNKSHMGSIQKVIALILVTDSMNKWMEEKNMPLKHYQVNNKNSLNKQFN